MFPFWIPKGSRGRTWEFTVLFFREWGNEGGKGDSWGLEGEMRNSQVFMAKLLKKNQKLGVPTVNSRRKSVGKHRYKMGIHQILQGMQEKKEGKGL